MDDALPHRESTRTRRISLRNKRTRLGISNLAHTCKGKRIATQALHRRRIRKTCRHHPSLLTNQNLQDGRHQNHLQHHLHQHHAVVAQVGLSRRVSARRPQEGRKRVYGPKGGTSNGENQGQEIPKRFYHHRGTINRIDARK